MDKDYKVPNQLGSAVGKDPIKLSEAKKNFNKIFGFLKDKDIISEYVKVKTKISTYTLSKRKLIITYIALRCHEDKEFAKVIDGIDKDIKDKMSKIE